MKVIIGAVYNKITALSGDPKTTSFVSLKHSLVTFQLCHFILPKLWSIPVLVIASWFFNGQSVICQSSLHLKKQTQSFLQTLLQKVKVSEERFDKETLSNSS